jgi:hypothetical protein
VFKYSNPEIWQHKKYTISLRTKSHLFTNPIKIMDDDGNAIEVFYPADTILYMMWNDHIKVLDFVKK